MAGPLQGVKIVDLTTVLMGPYASQILGDMGADVIKVEPPGGDSVRGIPPFRHAGMGGVFLHCNRSKRSITLDLKQAEGRDVLLDLVRDADVFLYNVRPQAMERLGLGAETLHAINPGLIYVGVFGYGRDGPYASKPAYDDLIQGAAGIPALFLMAGATEPRYVPTAIADRTVGLHAVNAILGALYHKQRTGEGQTIDVPMFETMASMVLGDHIGGASFVPRDGALGYPRLIAPHRRPYATKDGHVCALIYNDKQWRSFFRLLGREDELDRDPRFANMDSRTRHINELYAWVAEILATRTTAEWLNILEEADIPVMPMHSLDTLLEDEHLRAIGFFEEIDHPTEGRIRTIGVPSRWSRTQPRASRLAPRAGEQSVGILRQLGYAEDKIQRLLAAHAVQAPD